MGKKLDMTLTPEEKTAGTKPVIIAKLGNPYLVRNLNNLIDEDGRPLATGEETSLCRCGHSKNRPYCDGTHSLINFVGKKRAHRVADRDDEYPGPGLTIIDNRGVCSHSEICTEDLPGVFRRYDRPWIDARGASAREIIAIIRRCPSGALSYRIEDERYQGVGGAPAVTATRNGPYHVSGGIPLDDDQGSAPETTDHYTLCRCGQTRNQPFCDGSHWK